MSRPHSAKCNHKPKAPILLNTTPFCDCRYCECTNCPDILKLLSFNVTDSPRRFDPKVCPQCDDKDTKPALSKESQELLNAVNHIKHDPCSCETVARGVRDNVHMNLGMTKRREQIVINSNVVEPEVKTEKTESKTKVVPSNREPSIRTQSEVGSNKCIPGQCKCCGSCSKK